MTSLEPRARRPIRDRLTRAELRRALIGYWVAATALGIVVIAATAIDDVIALPGMLILLLPLALTAGAFVLDVWRNPSLSKPSAYGWILLILYLGPIGASVYWVAHPLAATGATGGAVGPPSRLKNRTHGDYLASWLVGVAGILLLAFGVLLALHFAGVIELGDA